MFKTPKGFEYTVLHDTIPDEFRLRPGDQFEIYIFSNNGYKLVDPVIVNNSTSRITYNPAASSLTYEVNIFGKTDLPMIGTILLAGLTEKEAEDELEVLYQQNYIDPYVRLIVTNRRVTVFRGNANSVIVPLKNQNTSIIEVIGAAGGIPPTGKANKIKLIRQTGNSTQVSLIDLSTIEGVNQANTIAQANDIIYIDPTVNTEFFKEIAPIITAISGIVIIYAYFASFNP